MCPYSNLNNNPAFYLYGRHSCLLLQLSENHALLLEDNESCLCGAAILACCAAKTASKVIGKPDWFSETTAPDGTPGRVTQVDEGKGFQQAHYSTTENLHTLLGAGTTVTERQKCAKVAAQACMYMVSLFWSIGSAMPLPPGPQSNCQNALCHTSPVSHPYNTYLTHITRQSVVLLLGS